MTPARVREGGGGQVTGTVPYEGASDRYPRSGLCGDNQSATLCL
jgi:hypothetical protein